MRAGRRQKQAGASRDCSIGGGVALRRGAAACDLRPQYPRYPLMIQTRARTPFQVDKALRAGERASGMAQRLAKLAFEYSIDRRRVTPYSRAATEAFDMVYSGGKKVT